MKGDSFCWSFKTASVSQRKMWIPQTVQQKYGGSSFASGEGWKPYSHSLAGNYVQKNAFEKLPGIMYVSDWKTRYRNIICAWHSAVYSDPPATLVKSNSWSSENLYFQNLEGTLQLLSNYAVLTISSAFLNSLYQHPIFLTNTSHHIRHSKHHIWIFF